MRIPSWWRVVVIDGAMLLIWLSSVGAVVVYERGGLSVGRGPFTASLGATLEAKEQWFVVDYQGRQIGFSHATLIPEERHGMPGVGLIDQGRLTFNLMGQLQELEVNARAFIDADWRL